MRLECTKKLLDYIGIKPEKDLASTADPLFGWSANLILANRRKTIVVVHTDSHYFFVIHGVTAKHLKKLPKLIFEGLRGLLQSLRIRPEIIEQYLDDCGRELTFRANTSRTTVSVCNKVCERVRIMQGVLDNDDLYQHRVLSYLNHDLVPKKDYRYTRECLLELLHKKYGEDLQSCKAVELNVSLELLTPCTRCLRIPADVTLYQFHLILQNTFEWHDRHLHQFVLQTASSGYPTKIATPFYEEASAMSCTVLDSTNITLEEIFLEHQKLLYEYDFGDGWSHMISFKRFVDDCSQVDPVCLLAEGDAPMEDCSGPHGFAAVMQIINDPTHPDHRNACNWVRSIWWNPLDLKKINQRLKNICLIPFPVFWN